MWIKVLKLNLEEETIKFKRSNKIAQELWSYRSDQGRLDNQLELDNQIAQMEKKFLIRSKKIMHSDRKIQPGWLK